MTDSCDNTPLCNLAKIKFNEMDKRWDIRISAIQTSIAKAEALLQIRLEEMNNFRKQMQDERAAYMTRRESVLINLIVSMIIVSFGCVMTYILMK